MIQIKVLDAEKNIVAENSGQEEVNLTLRREYQEGDTIIFEIGGETGHYWMQVDDVLGKSLVYLTGDQTYEIPFEEKKFNLSPKAFTGEKQLISLRKARPYEVNIYRNLAENVNDQHGDVNCYPHASANVETRGEAVFAAKNAIDGVTANHSHGKWPFASWGINQRDDAQMKLEFGREIKTDRIILHTRADFPHDNWWVKATVEFSDGSSMVLDLEKTDVSQEFSFEEKTISWLVLKELIKADDPSPFPALTQIEVFGTECCLGEAKMEIREINENNKEYLELLLLADEQESMIDRYLERGEMYVLYDAGEVRAVCVVTQENDQILELKNLAVKPQCQRRGYGRKMIQFLCEKYRGKKAILQVGTGDSPATLPFYERCGFTQSHRIPGFFVDNYDHPIIECGKQLVDMVYLKQFL